jgi:hypothetical protein
VKYLEILRKHGWIFNVKKAAAIPDARLRHYSKED